MQVCAAENGYARSQRYEERYLGKGGCSQVVERWRDRKPDDRKWVAAKHVTDAADAEREVAALNLASKFGVPRVVQLKENLQHPCTGRVLVLE
ncbi:hypothetical protein ABBQ38_009877 [Trebouxia sp. C0009 RCD-2024]